MPRTIATMLTVALMGALLVWGATRVLARRGPEDTARRFLDAATKPDPQAVRPLLTKKAQEHWLSGEVRTPLDTGDCAKKAAVGKPVRDGDTAVVPVEPGDTACGQPYRLRLRLEDGEWRIYALSVTPEGMPEVTLDLEHPESVVGEMLAALLANDKTGELTNVIRALGSALTEFGKGLQRAGEQLEKVQPPAGSPSPGGSSR